MKAKIIFTLILAVSIILANCSSDDDFSPPVEPVDPEVGNGSPQNQDMAPGELANFDDDVIGIPGYPKGIEVLSGGIPAYRIQYFYNPDGKLLKFRTLNTGNSFETDYYYDNDGKLISLGDGYMKQNFYWENGRISYAFIDNPEWYGQRKRIDYTYDDQGLLTTSKTQFEDSDWHWSTNYTYFEDGNIKSIEKYSFDSERQELILTSSTSFNGYIEAKNLFHEVTIIPGQSVQQNFPTGKKIVHSESSEIDTYEESYVYKYDTHGRVTAKIFGGTKVVYLYY